MHECTASAARQVGGGGEWRVRVGDHRVVDEIDDGVLVVPVVRVAHRSVVYR